MDMKKLLQTLDGSSNKATEGSDDMKKLLQVVTEGKNPKTNRLSQAENIVYMNTPKPKPVDLNETPSLFKTYLKLVEEEDINQEDNLRLKLSEHLSEVKSTPAPKPAVRNFVAKNSPKSGAGAHEDKKRAAKQGDVKHKKQAVPVDENLSPPDGATAPPPKGKDGQYPIVTSGPHKGKRWSPQTPGPTNPAFKEGVAGPQHCWPGHRKVGTQPGTGKNAGKRVNDCKKIKKESVKPKTTPVNEGDE